MPKKKQKEAVSFITPSIIGHEGEGLDELVQGATKGSKFIDKIDKDLIGSTSCLITLKDNQLVFTGLPLTIQDVTEDKIILGISRLEEGKDKGKRTRLAKEITEIIKSDIEKQISEQVCKALKERPLVQLKCFKEKLKDKKEEPELKRNRGCLYLKIGSENSIKI